MVEIEIILKGELVVPSHLGHRLAASRGKAKNRLWTLLYLLLWLESVSKTPARWKENICSFIVKVSPK